MPPRPVDLNGFITPQYLAQSRGEAQQLARQLIKIERRRYPADRRYGEKFERLLQQQKKYNDKSAALLSFESNRLIEDFTSTSSSSPGCATRKDNEQPSHKFKELKARKKKICSRESLFNCILDNTVITVQPRRLGDTDDNMEARNAKDWDPESISAINAYIGRTTSYADSCGHGSIAKS